MEKASNGSCCWEERVATVWDAGGWRERAMGAAVGRRELTVWAAAGRRKEVVGATAGRRE